MALDLQLRSNGIGGSEIAAILGMDANRDPFSVYCDKLGLLEKSQPNTRMRWGKLLERAIVQGYSEQSGIATEWCDATIQRPDRHWHLYTPDAFAVGVDGDLTRRIGGVDAKNVSFDRVDLWGDPGSDDVPANILLQLQWYCSGADLPWWDAAALFGGNDLRIYRVHRDAEIESAILESAEQFWKMHVLARIPPDIGRTQAASEYLKKRFPKNVEPLRTATDEERELLAAVKSADERWTEINALCETLDNRLKLSIGAGEGLLDGPARVTYRLSADSRGVDWESAAREAIDLLARLTYQGGDIEREHQATLRRFISDHTKVLAAGSRRLNKNWQAFGKTRRRKK